MSTAFPHLPSQGGTCIVDDGPPIHHHPSSSWESIFFLLHCITTCTLSLQSPLSDRYDHPLEQLNKFASHASSDEEVIGYRLLGHRLPPPPPPHTISPHIQFNARALQIQRDFGQRTRHLPVKWINLSFQSAIKIRLLLHSLCKWNHHQHWLPKAPSASPTSTTSHPIPLLSRTTTTTMDAPQGCEANHKVELWLRCDAMDAQL